MAKHFDADAVASLHEVLSFTAGGKTHECLELSDDLFDSLMDVDKRRKAGELSPGAAQNTQLALITGQAAQEFAGLSLRVKGAILRWFFGEFAGGDAEDEAKNALGK